MENTNNDDGTNDNHIYMDGHNAIFVTNMDQDQFKRFCEFTLILKLKMVEIQEKYPHADQHEHQTDESNDALREWLDGVESVQRLFGHIVPSIETTRDEVGQILNLYQERLNLEVSLWL